MTLKKFFDDLTRNVNQAPQILNAEITDIDIMKIQHDEKVTVEQICITMSDGNKTYTFISAFNT